MKTRPWHQKLALTGVDPALVGASTLGSVAVAPQAQAAGQCVDYWYSSGGYAGCIGKIQTLLNYFRYGKTKLAVDNSFGPKTKAAVIEFQRTFGLVADGVVGPRPGTSSAPRRPVPGSSRATPTRRRAQRAAGSQARRIAEARHCATVTCADRRDVERSRRSGLACGWRRPPQGTRCTQPNGSSLRPLCRSSSAWRSRIVTGPGWPSPTVHCASADFTDPTGVTTAAVPHANTSVISPDGVAGLPLARC